MVRETTEKCQLINIKGIIEKSTFLKPLTKLLIQARIIYHLSKAVCQIGLTGNWDIPWLQVVESDLSPLHPHCDPHQEYSW